MEEENQRENKPVPEKKKRGRRIVKRMLKTVAWTVGALVLLVVAALCLVVWILTPEKLTPIVERVANENLNAQVRIERVELTVWKTFPMASVDVQGLEIRSKALDSCDSVPAYADSLLSLGRFRVEFNLAKVPLMQFDVKELLVDSPRANLVSLNDSVANYLVFPQSEDSDTASEISIMPDIVIHKFAITGNQGIRYTDMAANCSVTLNTDSVDLSYNQADQFYSLLFKGGVYAQMPEFHVDQTVPFYFKGDINWNTKNPYKCALRDFRAEVARMPVSVNADFDLTDTVSVKSLDLEMGPVRYADLTGQIPAVYLHGLERIKTDFAMSVKMSLDKPFRFGIDKQPSFHAELQIPNCYVQPGKYRDYRINQFAFDAKLAYDGDKPERSTVTLSRLLLDGFGINLSVTGNAAGLEKDPRIDAKMEGRLDFAKVLKLIPKELPVRLSGEMAVNTAMKFNLSDLDVKTFHKMQVNGDVKFTGIRYTVPKDSILVFARNAKIRFGTDNEFTDRNNEIRNILMASVSVDSLIAAMPGMFVAVNDASMGAGSLGKASDLLDTANITPMGARIKVGKLLMLSKADSSKIRVSGFESNGSIKRYRDAQRLPLLDFGIHAKRISYSDRTTHLSLREGDIDLAANMRPIRRNLRVQARIDSLCRLHPGLSRDSVVALYREQARLRRGTEQLSDDEYMDLSVDNQFKKIFRRWNMRGSVKAKRGMLFTPYFPLPNVLKNVDLTFNTDRFDIHSMTYKVGHSDFSMSGAVTNIQSALMGFKRRPLTFDFTVVSDTLDVNQLMGAAYRGSAFAADTTGSAAFNLSDVSDEEKLQQMVESSAENADTTVQHAIIIPKNLAVNFKVRNKYTRYADLDLSSLQGDLLVNNGVLKLQGLSGKTVDGGLDLDLVYATANKRDIGLGLFLDLKDIKVGRFLQMMPELDTIMPMLKGVDGIINARLAATTNVDSLMNVVVPSMNAALHIDGKNLVLLDSETFRKVAKMLLFKNKERNLVDSLSVEVAAYDSKIDVYPFILSMDRYRLGIVGTNDFDMNFNYHISIFKSPIPFLKFGINLSGNPDDIGFGIGKAKLKENEVARTTLITDSTKLNLFRQMNDIFRKGAAAALKSDMKMYGDADKRKLNRQRIDLSEQRLTHADSLKLMEEGIIEVPDTVAAQPLAECVAPDARKEPARRKWRKRRENRAAEPGRELEAVEPKKESEYNRSEN